MFLDMFLEMKPLYPSDSFRYDSFLANDFWVVSYLNGKVKCSLIANDATHKNIDIPFEAAYDSFDELPEWARKKITVLKVMNDEDGSGEFIARVGRRSSRDCYWLTIEGEDVNAK